MQVEREEERVDVIRRDVVSSFIMGNMYLLCFDSSINPIYLTLAFEHGSKKAILYERRKTDLVYSI